ncbi:integrase catalytic domain-containing protein [Trichonephila inaurata madagascariensis]|uniref:Integrase catalytic domain-containing protein n=1 Tax=Trichonephila inaurata madagascariensis TaxID=2747483 RepID=A0A8X6XLQ2_9ARAC|nr:integrase catalytic domain-containing protein [Trichonephila inaurata madagascariensis]
MDSNVLSDAILLHMLSSKIDRESQRQFQLNLKTTEVPSLQDFFSFLEIRCIQLESIRKTDFDAKSIPISNNVNLMHTVLLSETKIPFIKEKIVSTLGSEKVLQPSSEKLTFESHTRAVALASTKRSVAWGSEKGLLLTAVIYVNGHQGRLKLRCVFDSGLENLVIPQGIVLADEGFNQPSEISCLIGSEHFFDIFGTKQIPISNSNFRLIDSKFGYVVTRSYIDEPCYFKHCFLSKGWNTLDKTLRSFWETENISEEQPIISDELSYCEKHFEKTHFRKPCGRYSDSLPFKENIQENVNLGDSRSIASKRLDQLWRRLDRDPKLNNLYTKFIEEYLSLDHMEEIANIDDIASEEGFFLPHHGVLRARNRSRPLRVVFNGSQKTDLGISLNDVLCKGGVIQDDLFSIMLRARKHANFFSCDISCMFRQIEIHSHQRHFQKILWKKRSE